MYVGPADHYCGKATGDPKHCPPLFTSPAGAAQCHTTPLFWVTLVGSIVCAVALLVSLVFVSVTRKRKQKAAEEARQASEKTRLIGAGGSGEPTPIYRGF